MRFVDTNVLLYAVSGREDDAAKRRRARELLTEPGLAVSVQVLQEFYFQATRPTRRERLTHDEAVRVLQPILSFPLQAVTVDVFQGALVLRRRFGLSYWDSAILSAAKRLRCDVVYSEDLSPEQDYDGLRVINPFAPDRNQTMG